MVRSTPETPSIMAWWIFQITAVFPSARPCTTMSFQRGWFRSSIPAKARPPASESIRSSPGEGNVISAA